MGATRPTTTICKVRPSGGAGHVPESRGLLTAGDLVDEWLERAACNKRGLIEGSVSRVSTNGAAEDELHALIAVKRQAKFDTVIAAEGLRAYAARACIETAFREGALGTTGKKIARVWLPASNSRGSATATRGVRRRRSGAPSAGRE